MRGNVSLYSKSSHPRPQRSLYSCVLPEHSAREVIFLPLVCKRRRVQVCDQLTMQSAVGNINEKRISKSRKKWVRKKKKISESCNKARAIRVAYKTTSLSRFLISPFREIITNHGLSWCKRRLLIVCNPGCRLLMPFFLT